jgi:hypothetical protein
MDDGQRLTVKVKAVTRCVGGCRRAAAAPATSRRRSARACRLLKDLDNYKAEIDETQAKIAAMRAKGDDEWDIKKTVRRRRREEAGANAASATLARAPPPFRAGRDPHGVRDDGARDRQARGRGGGGVARVHGAGKEGSRGKGGTPPARPTPHHCLARVRRVSVCAQAEKADALRTHESWAAAAALVARWTAEDVSAAAGAGADEI